MFRFEFRTPRSPIGERGVFAEGKFSTLKWEKLKVDGGRFVVSDVEGFGVASGTCN